MKSIKRPNPVDGMTKGVRLFQWHSRDYFMLRNAEGHDMCLVRREPKAVCGKAAVKAAKRRRHAARNERERRLNAAREALRRRESAA